MPSDGNKRKMYTQSWTEKANSDRKNVLAFDRRSAFRLKTSLFLLAFCSFLRRVAGEKETRTKEELHEENAFGGFKRRIQRTRTLEMLQIVAISIEAFSPAGNSEPNENKFTCKFAPKERMAENGRAISKYSRNQLWEQ